MLASVLLVVSIDVPRPDGVRGDARLQPPTDAARDLRSTRLNRAACTSTSRFGGEGVVVEDAFLTPRQRASIRKVCFKPYGRLLNTSTGGSVVYVEVPKAGSTTFKKELGVYRPYAAAERSAHLLETKGRSAEGLPIPAFAIVREPLSRALSACGTVRKHLHGRCRHQQSAHRRSWAEACAQPWLRERNETAALDGYVDWLTSGDLARAAAARSAARTLQLELMHAFSQSFFLLGVCAWPAIDVVRLDRLEAGLSAFEEKHGRLLRASKAREPRPSFDVIAAKNVDTGGVTKLFDFVGQGEVTAVNQGATSSGGGVTAGGQADTLPMAAAMRRLAEHYGQDYACLGFRR